MANTPEIKTEGGFFTGATELVKYLTDNGMAIQSAKTEAANAIVEIDGFKYYWDRNNYCYRQFKNPLPDDEPFPNQLGFFTLDGLIDYVENNVERIIPETGAKLILQVVDHKNVRLLSHPDKHSKERHIIVSCEAHVPQIVFERYMDVERFNTMLLSTFIDTAPRGEVFKVVKSMTKEQKLNTSDDGVSQVITVKQGVSLASNIQFQNPVPLMPMRTFAEVKQPESNFTLRVNGDSEVALFEADGGAWKNEAVASIRDYLRSKLVNNSSVVVIA